MTTCKNCESDFEGKYCPNCSQKADTHRLTLPHIGHDVLHAVTHTDKGIFFLMKSMVTRPGIVVREYAAGKRKKYFNPITYLLIVLAVQIYAVKKVDFYGKFTTKMGEMVKSAVEARGGNGESETFNTEMQNARKQASVASDNAKLITFIYIPVLALLTWLLFFKSGYNYAENLVLHIFVNGQTALFFLVVCIVPVIVNPNLVGIAMYAYLLFNIVYALFAYRQFYGQGWGLTIGKGLLAQIIYMVFITYSSKVIVMIFS